MATEPSPAILVYRRASGRFDALRESLARADFQPVAPPDAAAEWEVVDEAGTRVRGCGTAVVVEARDSRAGRAFDGRFRLAFPSEREIPDGGEAPVAIDRIAGSDEAGKGDRGLALAVAAVVVPCAAEREAIRRGVRDSKACAAEELVALAEWVRAAFAHEMRTIAPDARAAALRAHGGNESRLLAAMHAECLEALCGRAPFAFARVDRFAPGRPVAALVGSRRPEVFVDECVRGERHVACAAASIVAGALVRSTARGNGARHVP